ncbi:MAG TPA: DUF4162 domain-containing protein [Terriglobia bacterium]|nr:DUF4162 domain-containing protein [Terriglobia bacterium]
MHKSFRFSIRSPLATRRVSANYGQPQGCDRSEAQLGEDQLSFRVAAKSELPQIIRYLVDQGAQIFEVTPSQPSLEEIFLQVIGKDSVL